MRIAQYLLRRPFHSGKEKAQELSFLNVLISQHDEVELFTSVYKNAINTDRIILFERSHFAAYSKCGLKELVNHIDTYCSTRRLNRNELRRDMLHGNLNSVLIQC